MADIRDDMMQVAKGVFEQVRGQVIPEVQVLVVLRHRGGAQVQAGDVPLVELPKVLYRAQEAVQRGEAESMLYLPSRFKA